MSKKKREKKRRKKNLVIYNVPESENQDPRERQREDEAFCNDTFRNAMNVEQEDYNI